MVVTLALEATAVADPAAWAVILALEATVEVTLGQAAMEGTADLATSLVQVGVRQRSITLRATQC